jgi:hypothetical protein
LGKEQLSTTKKEIDISGLDVYFLEVKTADSITTKKIIVQH